MEEDTRTKYCTNLAKQILLNATFICLAIIMCSRGPTILDLQQIYEASIEKISMGLVAGSIGGIVGAVIAGFLFNNFPHLRYLFMFEFLLGVGITNALLPILGSVELFFAVFFINGMHIAGIHTGCNVLCLEIWRGHKGGPHMHAMHFCFSVGAVIGPLMSQPFLSRKIDGNHDTLSHAEGNSTGPGEEEEFTESKIDMLYFLSGMSIAFVSLGYLYLGLKSVCKWRRSVRLDEDGPKLQQPKKEIIYKCSDKILIVLMFIFIGIYVGMEFGVINYLTAFAVKSELHLSKAEGTNLLAIYLAPFALSRIIAVFLAIKLRPNHIIIFNGVFVVIGNIIILICAEKSALFLKIGYAIFGFGMGSTFANTWMWLEEYFKISSHVASGLNIGGGLGVNIAPLVVGQFIEETPMVLVYLQVATTLVSICIFTAGTIIGRKSLKENRRNKRRMKQEEKELKSMLKD